MNENENIATSESQNNKIFDYMKDGNRITALDALKLFGCFRLSARIRDLRDRYPEMEIRTEMVTLANKKRVAQYYINKGNN